MKKKLYPYKNETYTVDQIAQMANKTVKAVRRRLGQGWSVDRIIEAPNSGGKRRGVYECDGGLVTVAEMAELTGLSETGVRNRLKRGWTAKEIVSKPSTRSRAKDQLGDSMVEPIEIMFERHINGVYASMQPKIGKVYEAYPNKEQYEYHQRAFYIIMLDNGKPLIVYPNEFEIAEKAKKGGTHSGTDET